MSAEPTAGAWLARLRAGDLTAVELAERQLGLLDRAAHLNAVAAVDGERVLRDAAEADRRRAAGDDGPLLGLPITIKDSLAVAGLPCLSGSVARAGHVPAEDATVVRRARDAGAFVLAKTTVPEYMWSYETESIPHGRTVNPYDAARTSGGSSGGEAALLAAGASLLGIGTDGGGSIRIPSHYCGTVGLRPSARLVPETGVWPPSRDTGMLDMAAVGPMGRSVADLALLLDVIAGGDESDPFVGPATVGDHRSVAVADLRVGFYPDDGAWPATDETRAAISAAADALRDAGAHVEEVAPPQIADAVDLFFVMMAADGGARARADLAAAGTAATSRRCCGCSRTWRSTRCPPSSTSTRSPPGARCARACSSSSGPTTWCSRPSLPGRRRCTAAAPVTTCRSRATCRGPTRWRTASRASRSRSCPPAASGGCRWASTSQPASSGPRRARGRCGDRAAARRLRTRSPGRCSRSAAQRMNEPPLTSNVAPVM